VLIRHEHSLSAPVTSIKECPDWLVTSNTEHFVAVRTELHIVTPRKTTI
jgi:hypothetical protein